jgi:hypothetical protein
MSRRPIYYIISVFRYFIRNTKLIFRRLIYHAELISRYFIYLFRVSILLLNKRYLFSLIILILYLKIDIIPVRIFTALFYNFRYRIDNII